MINFSNAMERASKVYKSRVYIDIKDFFLDAFICPKCKEVIIYQECNGYLRENKNDNSFICPLCNKSF